MSRQKSRLEKIWRPKGIVPALLILVWLFLSGSSHLQNQYDPKQAENAFAAGQRLYEQGKYKLAADTLERAVAIFEQLKNVPGHVQSMNLRAECLANMGQCDEAGELLHRSLGLAIPALGEDHVEVAQTYYYLSRFAGGCARKFDEAFAFMGKSTAIKLKLYGKEDPAIAFDYTFLGYMLNSKGEFDSALHYLTHALEIRKRALPEDDVETSNTMYNLAISYDGISDLAKALDLHLKSLRIREEKLGPLHPSVSNSINHLGRLYRRFGNLDRALDYYQKALEIRKASLGNEHPNVGSSYYEIGNLYGTISNYHNAIQYLQQGHRIMENNVQSSDDILCTYYAYTGKMYGLLGDHHSAVGYLHKAISLGEKIMKPDHPYLAVIYNLAGEYYVDKNDLKNQSIYFQKAIGIYRKVYGDGSEREGDVISKMGTSSSANNSFSEAEQLFQNALAIYVSKLGSQNPKVAGIHLSVGDLFSKRGQYADALMAYNRALDAISSAPTEDVYANPELDQLESKPLAFKIAQNKALMLVQYAEAKDNDLLILKGAFSTCQFAISLADEIQEGYSHEKARADLEKETRRVYNMAMALAWRLLSLTGDELYMKEAFIVSGKSKSTLLLENTRDLRAKTLAGVPDSLVNEERDMKTVLTYYNDKLSHARKQKDTAQAKLFENGLFETQGRLDKLKKGLETAFPSYYNLKYAAGDIDIEKIQALLSRHSGLLVEYFVTDTSIYKFIVSAKEFDLECLRKDSISQLIKDYERSITDASFIINNRGEADRLYTRTSHELYRKLLSLGHYEDDRHRNLVIPDDILATLSFSTLLREPFNGQTPDYGSLPYLLRRWAISFAYSSIFISDSQSNTSRLGLPFAGFAPAYFGQQFANVDTTLHPMVHVVARSGNLPLPGAQDEVRSIAEFMNGESWLAQKATESAFKQHAPNYNILHLAMHSLLNNEDPQFSELLFSPMSDPVDDGFLTVSEIYNIRLNAQLVVLSACSSGYGKIQSGEGPISISRAFSYAGCPSILMSLWKIPDAGTADIMKNFYAELKDGKTKDEALRLAQLKFLGETQDPLYRHPYFWAGFVVMGDTGPVQSAKSIAGFYYGLGLLVVVIALVVARIRRSRLHSIRSSN